MTDILVGAFAVFGLAIYLYVVHQRESLVARWDTVATVNNLPALRAMYIWLFIVPIAARILDSVASPFVVPGTEGTLKLNLELPFSWQVFFFAALSASLSNLVYFYSCPELVRRFPTYSIFQQEGRDLNFLVGYAKASQVEVDEYSLELHNTHSELGRTQAQQLFWQLFDSDNKKRPILRAACLLFQGIALWGIAIVLWQNISFVYERVSIKALLGAT